MQGRGTVRALVAMSIAVVFGSAAVVSLFQLITGYQQELENAQQPEDQVMVMVAAHDLYAGVTIQPEDLIAVPVAPRFLSQGTFLTPDYLVGQRPRDRILANDVIRAERLANPETGEGLNVLIPAGMRAISVEIADGAALSGHLRPGSYVDVVATLPHDTIPGDVETHTILQAMFVLAVNDVTARGQQSVGPGAGKSTVTMLSTPLESLALAHADVIGELQFTLRNDLDIESYVALKGMDQNGMFPRVAEFIEKQKQRPVNKSRIEIVAPTEAEPETIEVDVIQGKVRETLSFPVRPPAE